MKKKSGKWENTKDNRNFVKQNREYRDKLVKEYHAKVFKRFLQKTKMNKNTTG